jgi:transcription initiation factor TFIIIB Brf1 subunit/transcription initiation factor TFIIB
MTEQCSHPTRLDDERTGDEVCTGCGLVLSSFLTLPAVSARDFGIGSDAADYGGSCCHDRTYRPAGWEAFISDTCFNMCLAAETAICSYRHYRKMREHSSSRGFCNLDLAAFAIYSNCVQIGAGRSPHQIANATGADVRRMCDLQDIFHDTSLLYDDAKCYLSHLRYHLDLTGSDEMVLRGWVDAMPLDGCRPQTLAAAIVYMYCEMDNRERDNRKRSWKEIAIAAHVSIDCLRRTVNRLKIMYPLFKRQ